MPLQTFEPPRPADIELNVVAGRASADVKLAHRVAAVLQRTIISDQLPNGHSMGTAAEIRARYKVGRRALREAIGILELRGIARLRPGPSGGIIVTKPDFANLVNLTLLYLYANRSGPVEICEFRRSVLTAVTKKLLDRTSKSACLSRSDIADPDLPRFLAAQTGNGALEFAVEFVESLREACITPQSAAAPGIHDAPLQLAICRSDRDAALRELDAYLAGDERQMAETWTGLPEICQAQTRAGKLAYRLALDILRDVVDHPDRSGDLLGSETEIGKRFDANGEIVRQAIRLIEDLGVGAPRRGRYGGVALRLPDAASIAALIPHLLAQKRLSVLTCFDAGRFLSEEIARLAAKRIKNSHKPRVRLSPPSEASHDNIMMIDQLIQTHAGNALLSSIERGMGFYSVAIEPPALVKPVNAGWIMALSQRVLEAVEEGDVEEASAAARRRFEFMSLRFAEPKRFFDDDGPRKTTEDQ